MNTHLLNEHEVATHLGLAVSTLRRWRWAGVGPAFVKLGRAVRYEPEAVAAFIGEGRRQGFAADGDRLSKLGRVGIPGP